MRGQRFQPDLVARIARSKNALCVGIDPHTDQLPPFLAAKAAASPLSFLQSFSAIHLDAAVGAQAPAVKFQSAFYEAFGSEGVAELERSVSEARNRGLYVILDAKRGDIASTMRAYGTTAFDRIGADCLTVTPYMGLDVIDPLIPWLERGKGVFVVWVTSNPGGAEVQEIALHDGSVFAEHLWRRIEEKMSALGLLESIGLVVGATKVERLSALGLLQRITAQPLLLPGVGAQGAVVTQRMKGLVGAGAGALVPISRGISQPPGEAILQREESSWVDYAAIVTKAAVAAASSVSF